MKKILSISFILSALFLFASCERNMVSYVIPAGNPLVSFYSDAAVYEMAPEDGGKIVVELNRVVTTDALTVPVTITDATGGLFTPAKNQFDFAAGEAKATLDLTYTDIADFEFGKKYKVTIALNPAADADIVSPSGYDEVEVVASRKMTKVSKGMGTYYSDFFEEEWAQELQSTVEAPNYYIWPGCWAAGTDITFTMEAGQPVLASLPTVLCLCMSLRQPLLTVHPLLHTIQPTTRLFTMLFIVFPLVRSVSPMSTTNFLQV